MRKLVILYGAFFILMVAGCSFDKKDETLVDSSNNTVTTSEKEKVSISKKEYVSIVGTWECLDEAGKGDEVSIKQNDKGLTIQYYGEDATETEFTERLEEKDSTYFRFENKEAEVAYMIDLTADGNIILNRGTTNPEMTGLSKPMEYKKISNNVSEKFENTMNKEETNYTLQKIKEQVEKTGDFEILKKEPGFDDDDYKVLAIQESEGYGFISGPDNGEPAAILKDESGNVISEENPSTDPRATTLREARELIEKLKNK